MLGTVHVPVAPDSCDSPRAGTAWAHTCHFQSLLQELNTPNSGFLLPLHSATAPGKNLPKHHGISEQLFSRNPSPNQKSLGNFASGMKQNPVFCSQSFTKASFIISSHHCWEAIRDFNTYSLLLIDIKPGKSRAGMTFRLSQRVFKRSLSLLLFARKSASLVGKREGGKKNIQHKREGNLLL